jgi:two-component system sensor histidine kinase/response regulator
MVYYDKPHTISQSELDMSKAIAHHVAAAIARFSAVEELRETVRFNEIFTGILGHDLRNPLSAIMAAAQLALTRADSERLAVPLGRILSSGDRMSRMIDQLLDFTRVRVGQGIPLNPERAELSAVISQIMEEIESASPGWELELQLRGNTAGVWDSDRMSQVFSNLIGNAVRHGDIAGGCRIRVDGTKRDTVTVTVHNMGVIPQQIRQRIFEPMVGRSDRGEKSQGLGLGLYITKELVAAHSGSIDVTSSADLGTTFTVTVPRRTAVDMNEAN